MLPPITEDLTPTEIHDVLFPHFVASGENILTTYVDFELPHFGGPTKGDIFFLIEPSISLKQLEGNREAFDWIPRVNQFGLFSITLHIVPVHDAWVPNPPPPRVRPIPGVLR